jgi:mRNA interferase MazF
VWTADLDPTHGREQSGIRPVLIVSVDPFNRGPRGLVIIVPITGTNRGIASHVRVDPPQGELSKQSVIMTEQIRAISKDRLDRRLGAVTAGTMRDVENLLRMLLDL